MIGQTISHYKILEEIGAGGMGVVYKAEDTKLKRIVALKFLPPELTRDPEAKKRFLHEARAASALDHPNICSIFEIDETQDGQMYMAMGYYEGQTLKEKIASGPLPLAETINIATQIAEGLNKAHQKNIVHRDIKAANIIITGEGIVKILDFGLAKLKGATKLTKEGTTLGTVAYMSPEQASGDHRSDIWSLGIILYEMITGQLPFKGEYEQAVMYAIMNEEPEPVTGMRTGVPLQLEQIINKALCKNPEQRYQHMDDFLVDLNRVKSNSSSDKAAADVRRKKPTRAVLFSAVVLFMAFLAGYFVVNTIFKGEQPVALQKPMLVVLPFENLGNPDDEYFTDGMYEEVTTRLAMVNNLGVISSLSAKKYMQTRKTIKEIGTELGVEYVLKGTVRWARSKTAPGKIRVSTQLIRAADDTNIWADTYDRVIDDTFEVQTDIARRVVDELNMTLGEREIRNVEISHTNNMEAYRAFLKAEYLIGRPHFTQDMWPEVINNYERAVELDPKFALAWAELARAHARLVFFSLDLSEERKEKAKAAAKRAIELNPGSPRVHLSLSYYYLWISRDDYKSLTELEIAQKGLPNNTSIMNAKVNIYELQGRFKESLELMKTARQLNPLSVSVLLNMAFAHWFLREYPEGTEVSNQAIVLNPEEAWGHLYRAIIFWSWKGAVPEARQAIGNALQSHSWIPYMWFWQDVGEHKFQEAADRLEKNGIEWINIKISKIPRAQLDAYLYEFTGKPELARQHYLMAKQALETDVQQSPDDPRLYSSLGIVLASLGENEAAIKASKRATKILPITKDAVYSTPFTFDLALTYTILGEIDLALDQVEYLMSINCAYSPGWISLDPRWERLKGHPRYKKILQEYRKKYKY